MLQILVSIKTGSVMPLAATLIVSVLLAWWAKSLPILIFFAIYVFFYSVKIILYFITNKFSLLIYLLELGLIVAAAVQINHAWGAIWCSFSILVLALLFPLFYRTK